MRTTLRIDPELLRLAKKLAMERNETLTKVMEDALRVAVQGARSSAVKRKIKLHTFKGKGVLPGVDLDDSLGLLKIMEEE